MSADGESKAAAGLAAFEALLTVEGVDASSALAKRMAANARDATEQRRAIVALDFAIAVQAARRKYDDSTGQALDGMN